MILDTIKNTNINDPNKTDNTPYLLRLKKRSYTICNSFYFPF
jgi:hypothetical protein